MTDQMCEEIYNEAEREELFESIYLSSLREEMASRFVSDAINEFDNKPNLSFTTSDLWTWAVKRIDDELEQDLVKSQGYLEGKTWLDFTNEFITLIDGAKKQKDSKFYTELFTIYKRALWGLEDIKDNNGESLKDAEPNKFDMYRTYPVHDDKYKLQHDNISSILPKI